MQTSEIEKYRYIQVGRPTNPTRPGDTRSLTNNERKGEDELRDLVGATRADFQLR